MYCFKNFQQPLFISATQVHFRRGCSTKNDWICFSQYSIQHFQKREWITIQGYNDYSIIHVNFFELKDFKILQLYLYWNIFFLKKTVFPHAYSFQNFPSLFKRLRCSARFWVNLAPKPTQRPFQSICRRVLKAFIDYASILVVTWHREQIAFNRRPSCLVVTFVGLRFWTKAPRSGCQAIKCQMVFFSNQLVLVIHGPVPYLLDSYLSYLDHLKRKKTVSLKRVISFAGFTLNKASTIDFERLLTVRCKQACITSYPSCREKWSIIMGYPLPPPNPT